MQGPKNLSITSKCILVMVLVNSHAQSLCFWIKVLKEKSLTQVYLILLVKNRTLAEWELWQCHYHDSFFSFHFPPVLQQWTEFNLEWFTYLSSSKLLPAFQKTYMIHGRGQSMSFHHIQYSRLLIIFLSLRSLCFIHCNWYCKAAFVLSAASLLMPCLTVCIQVLHNSGRPGWWMERICKL